MTTDNVFAGAAILQPDEKLTENLQRVEVLSQRLTQVITNYRPHNPSLDGPSNDLFVDAIGSFWAEFTQNPAQLFEQQSQYWSQSVANFVEAQQGVFASFASDAEDEAEIEPCTDRRFKNPMWSQNPYFRYIRQQYELNANAIRDAVSETDLAPLDQRRLSYFANQIIDMMSPTNFLPTNPDALEKAVETKGQSLIDGLENLVSDLEANNGELVVRLADESAFELGKNIATSQGDVVFRNRMIELIQYKATTPQVHEIPMVLFPPWINKFYILDLKEQNSLIKWITDQGYTLFVVSWVNPDDTYADTGLEEYITEGYLTAMNVAREITGAKKVNAVGYCIGGTTLALTLSLLKQRGENIVNSATFFTTLTDFSDQGEFTPFLQNDFVDGIEAEIGDRGILPSFVMARTFSFLRANDLIYGPAIRSYLMGEAPPAFDLLFWNGDGANLPGKMAKQYLRGLCQRNEFANEGFELFGQSLRLSDIDVPVCSIACETDHIAAWKNCYHGLTQIGSQDKRFILTQSGHIAGIVNPPSKQKYGHYVNEDLSVGPDAWQENGDFVPGSWWPCWEDWLKQRSGDMVSAPAQGSAKNPKIQPAPGSYVLCGPYDAIKN